MSSILNFIKKRALFLGLISGFTLFLLGSLYALKTQFEKSGLVREARDKEKAKRAALWSDKVFPVDKNVKAVRENAQAEKKLLLKTLGVLRESFLRISISQCRRIFGLQSWCLKAVTKLLALAMQ